MPYILSDEMQIIGKLQQWNCLFCSRWESMKILKKSTKRYRH